MTKEIQAFLTKKNVIQFVVYTWKTTKIVWVSGYLFSIAIFTKKIQDCLIEVILNLVCKVYVENIVW